MKASRKAIEWLICFSIVNLFKKSKKFNESYNLSKGARLQPTYLKYNLGLLRLFSFSHLCS